MNLDVSPYVAPGIWQTRAIAIASTVMRYHGVSYEDLHGTSRTRQIVTVRRQCAGLIKEFTGLSLSGIAKPSGLRGHDGVIYHLKKLADLIETDRKEAEDMANLRSILKSELPDITKLATTPKTTEKRA